MAKITQLVRRKSNNVRGRRDSKTRERKGEGTREQTQGFPSKILSSSLE